MSASASDGPLWRRFVEAPVVDDAASVERALADLTASCAADEALAPLATVMAEPAVARLLAGVFGASPYLTGLAVRNPARLMQVLSQAPETRLAALAEVLADSMARAEAVAAAMSALRLYKSEVALLIALADLGGAFPVMAAAEALSDAADAALRHAVRFLLRRAATAGQFVPADVEAPERDSGFIVIAMGKHGARELNYSSDIDLIVFFERGRARLAEAVEPESFFVRLTRDLVRLMQERTPEGYVFRTDLRLRPDPGATQVAMSTAAALHYYESFGQNWERAALIKARAVAGDVDAGENLLAEIAPFIWRKYLDYAAIADIHAMKRQIHAFKGFGNIGVAGHNIKLGRGGIREIEFFAQTQQLIAGGRQKDMRTAATLDALRRLQTRGWIAASTRADLERAYLLLRRIEHRLQMVADEQTQMLPAEPRRLLRVARLCGYATIEAFGAALTAELETVQRHYGALFEDVPELTSGQGNLVFTGDDHDPATVETLKHMGFSEPGTVIDIVKGWHFGRYPAMRSARARERLTEFLPVLLDAVARTADPLRALLTFDRFLSELPAGVQLFSLLRSNPSLLRLLADIMGTAPRLASSLSRRPRLLDAVLDPGFFGTVPGPDVLRQRVRAEIAGARDYQERLDRARVVGNEQAFLIGVRVLSDTISAAKAGSAYALVAKSLIAEMALAAEAEHARRHGQMPGGAAAVIAMGKLGGDEMAANSDLDLIVVYDFAAGAPQSEGAKPLPGLQYYTRLTQRLVAAIAAPTAEGRLYEVDMRLRPSGTSGPVASHIDSFTTYQREAAWTWEHMALTRAAVIAGPEPLRRRIEAVIGAVLVRPRRRETLVSDVREMRARIAAQKPARSHWDLKHVRGGLIDLEFIAQYLQLLHAHAYPEVLDQNTPAALEKLAGAGLIAPADADVLLPAAALYQALSQIVRLCLDGPFEPSAAPLGLKLLLARAAGLPGFAQLEAVVVETEARVAEVYERIVA